MDLQEQRAAALMVAATMHSGRADISPAHLTRYADQFLPWLGAPETTRMTATLTIPGTAFAVTTDGGHMTTTATVDNTQVVVAISTQDDKGNATADQLTWTTDDDGALITPSVSDDTKTFTGTFLGVEGTVNITASDPSAPNVASFVATVVIGAGATSQLAGTVTVS